MTTFTELLDLALSDVDGGLSLDHDPALAEALRRIRATPDGALSFEPEAGELDHGNRFAQHRGRSVEPAYCPVEDLPESTTSAADTPSTSYGAALT